MRIKLGDLTYWLNKKNQTATVCKCVKHRKPFSVKIPEEIKDKGNIYPVIAIEYEAFKECINLKSITLSDSVTKIGDFAFFGCNNLESITIPDSVTDIGWRAFHWCNNLTEIRIPGTEKAFPLWVSLMESEYADLVRQV